MSVSIMFSYFNKIKLKLCEKKAGLEPETDLFQATIMGTEVVYALWMHCICIEMLYQLHKLL